MQIPVGIESSFKGVVDLIKMKAVLWKEEKLGAEFEYAEIPADLKEQVEKYRKELVETAVEQDEKLMEDYLNGKAISESETPPKSCASLLPGNFFIPLETVLDPDRSKS